MVKAIRKTNQSLTDFNRINETPRQSSARTNTASVNIYNFHNPPNKQNKKITEVAGNFKSKSEIFRKKFLQSVFIRTDASEIYLSPTANNRLPLKKTAHKRPRINILDYR